MNMRTMKAIDHYAGIPICLLLDVYSRFRAFFASPPPRHPAKILLMKYFGMGSILLATPMLHALRQKYPDIGIGFMTLASNRDLVERLGLVDTVYLLRTDTAGHFAADAFRQLRAIRREKYDVTIDLEFFAKFSTIMSFLAGSPIRIGYFLRQMWRGSLLTHQVYYNQKRHITEVFAALVTPLQTVVTDFSMSVPLISEADERAADLLLESCGITGNTPFFVLNVNASDLSRERCWPLDFFRELSCELLQRTDARLVFIGVEGDKAQVAQVLDGLEDQRYVANLAGRTSLGELMAIIRRGRLFIGNDSGPLHLAAVLGIPTVSFFGPETPTLYGPQGQQHLVFYENIYCSPCLNVFNAKTAPCAGNNVCMQSIDPAHVLQTILERFSAEICSCSVTISRYEQRPGSDEDRNHSGSV